jgi:hypothetical protein
MNVICDNARFSNSKKIVYSEKKLLAGNETNRIPMIK